MLNILSAQARQALSPAVKRWLSDTKASAALLLVRVNRHAFSAERVVLNEVTGKILRRKRSATYNAVPSGTWRAVTSGISEHLSNREMERHGSDAIVITATPSELVSLMSETTEWDHIDFAPVAPSLVIHAHTWQARVKPRAPQMIEMSLATTQLKKAVAKKTAVKKTAVKKTAVKKTAAKKTAAKKTAAKKTAAKKTAAKKTAAKKTAGKK